VLISSVEQPDQQRQLINTQRKERHPNGPFVSHWRDKIKGLKPPVSLTQRLNK